MMTLKVYNSLTQTKEEFHPLQKGKVGMYVCGITAYDSCHMGHARAAVAFDVIFRYLKYLGYDVRFVRNYTDVDDKIIQRAREKNISCKELTEQYIAEYREDMKMLQVLTPTVEPKATEHIPEMIETIRQLIDQEKAYAVGGNVYYRVRAFQDYGKLSHKKIEDLESGARIEIDETKKDPLDFALWKAAKPGEPTWESPWGPGRPGWHIECSAMSTKYLGQPFDIHGGGRDLIFPHHENEIAQAEGACGKDFCRYFLHNGFININAEKMSKSLKNFMTIRQVVEEHDAEVVRYFLVSAHYGSPIDYTEKNLADAKAALDRLYTLMGRLETIPLQKKLKAPKTTTDLEKELVDDLSLWPKKFEQAMNEDFNTSQALGALFETVRLINKYLDAVETQATPVARWTRMQFESARLLFAQVLGIGSLPPKVYFERIKNKNLAAASLSSETVEALLTKRREARLAKDFAEADRIRKKLFDLGVELKDNPDGTTTWHVG